MFRRITAAALGALLALSVSTTVAPANAATSSNTTMSDQDLRAAGYQRMAVVNSGAVTGTLWRIIQPAGAWTWHANVHHAAPGTEVWAYNWFDNVVSSAVVPQGEIGVNTGTWSSFGRFRVCFRLVDSTARCSYYSQT